MTAKIHPLRESLFERPDVDVRAFAVIAAEVERQELAKVRARAEARLRAGDVDEAIVQKAIADTRRAAS
jgi:hypothetical protein